MQDSIVIYFFLNNNNIYSKIKKILELKKNDSKTSESFAH